MYGRGLKHLSLSSFCQFAIDEYPRNPITFPKDEDITNALNDNDNELLQQPDDNIEDRAITILFRIRRSDLRLSALGIEATAAPLVFLGRYREADTCVKSCLDTIGSLPARVIQGEARGGSRPEFVAALDCLHESPASSLLERSSICAAAYGDVDLLEYLRTQFQVNLDCLVEETSPVSAAIYCGHVGVLVYLQEHQIAILPDRRQKLPIITAIDNGNDEMVEYLPTVARVEESRITELYTGDYARRYWLASSPREGHDTSASGFNWPLYPRARLTV